MKNIQYTAEEKWLYQSGADWILQDDFACVMGQHLPGFPFLQVDYKTQDFFADLLKLIAWLKIFNLEANTLAGSFIKGRL